MSKTDAERALEIYKCFTKQTDFVVAYLSTARQYEHQTRVEVPNLKHAPVNLGKQLEDYLMDPDFEINRRQYMAEQESKKGRGINGASKTAATTSKNESESRAAAGRTLPNAQTPAPKITQSAKGPDPDLIDFFDSIEQNQQPMATQPGIQHPSFGHNVAQFPVQQSGYGQQNGFVAQHNPYQSPPVQFQPQSPLQQQPFSTGFNLPQQPQQLQPNFTGAGFGGYTPQPSFQPGVLSSIPQDSAASFQPQNTQQIPNMQTGNQQQTTNPFRQSVMANPIGTVVPPSFTSSPPITAPMQRQSTNPFAKSVSPQPNQQTFSPQPVQKPQYPQTAPLPSAEFQQPMATGTNPFARSLAMNAQRPQTSGGLVPQPSGSTNPFRQSQFVNTATGSGWQNDQQPIGGGLDNLQTVPVFPRPAQQQPWQQ